MVTLYPQPDKAVAGSEGGLAPPPTTGRNPLTVR